VSWTTGGSDAEKVISRAVHDGTLDAFRELLGFKSFGGNGFQSATYTQEGGGGGGYYGSGGIGNGGAGGGTGGDGLGSATPSTIGKHGIPQLGGQLPKSVHGAVDKVNKASGAAINDAISNGAGSAVGSPFDRTRFAAELKAKPWLKEKIFQLAAGEDRPSRGQSLLANQSVMEEIFNRAIVRGTSLEAQAKWVRERGGYYAGHPSHLTALERRNAEENWRKVLGGSNVSNYATDNSSNAPGNHLADRDQAGGRFRLRNKYNGEYFFAPGNAERGFARRWDKLMQDEAASEAARAAHGAHLADHIRHHLGPSAKAGEIGHARVSIDLSGFPKGTRTKASASGLFKEARINRGRVMPMASEDA
jgi:hypothetical protein